MARSKITGIYNIVHTVSGRRYVGSALSVHRRWRNHLSLLRRGQHHCTHLQRAWTMYGETAFEFSLVAACSRTKLISLEQLHIDTTPKNLLFNTRKVAGVSTGHTPSAEVKAKISLASKLRWADPVFRARMSISMTGLQHDQETKSKMSASAISRSANPVYRMKMSARLNGRKISSSAKAKISAANKGRIVLPGTREKQSVLRKTLWADPVWRAKMLAARAAKKAARITRPLFAGDRYMITVS